MPEPVLTFCSCLTRGLPCCCSCACRAACRDVGGFCDSSRMLAFSSSSESSLATLAGGAAGAAPTPALTMLRATRGRFKAGWASGGGARVAEEEEEEAFAEGTLRTDDAAAEEEDGAAAAAAATPRANCENDSAGIGATCEVALLNGS